MPKINPGKDFWSGIMFLCFGVAGIFVARGYSMGTPGRMGPGYFPVVLGVVLLALGLLLVGRSIMAGDEALPGGAVRPLLVLVMSIVVFAITIVPLGLILSLIATVVVTAMAGREAKAVETAVLGIILTAMSVGIFHYALRLPLPIWPSFV